VSRPLLWQVITPAPASVAHRSCRRHTSTAWATSVTPPRAPRGRPSGSCESFAVCGLGCRRSIDRSTALTRDDRRRRVRHTYMHRRMWAELTERAGADVTHGAAQAVADRFYVIPEETRAANRRRSAAGRGSLLVDGCVSCVYSTGPNAVKGVIQIDRGRLRCGLVLLTRPPFPTPHPTTTTTGTYVHERVPASARLDPLVEGGSALQAAHPYRLANGYVWRVMGNRSWQG
jgi:hypothetical protein